MSNRVVVASDGTPESQDALELGSALARAIDGGVSLISVYQPLPILIPLVGPDYARLARRQTETMLRHQRQGHTPEPTVAALSSESVPRAIRRYAERWRAPVVVIGSKPHTATGHAAIGRRGRQLLDGSRFALAIAAHGRRDRHDGIGRIGVGFDGEAESLQALSFASRLARPHKSRLTLLGVVDNRLPLAIPDLHEDTREWEQAFEKAAERLAARAEHAARERGVEVEVETAIGDPGQELARLAAGLDLLVIGSRRWGTLARLMIGGAGETLVSNAPCSLLIVPRPASTANGERGAERDLDAAVAQR